MYGSGNIMDEIRESFRKGSVVTKLIYVNLGVFIVVKLLFVFYFLSFGEYTLSQKELLFQDRFLRYLMVPSELNQLMLRPWTLFTYMFLHFGFIHIIFNLLVLFWFGRIFLHYLNAKQLLTTYILGGLAGAFVFILFYNLFPAFTSGNALGASAAIMAIVMGVSFYAPESEVYLMFFGQVKLKYIALVYIIIDVLMIASDNSGGHISHLGGAAYGYLFALQYRRGKDAGKFFSGIIDSLVSLFKPRPKLKVSYKSQARQMNDLDYNKQKAENQKEIDRILDKIAKAGYDSLTKKEKETLFKMSDKS